MAIADRSGPVIPDPRLDIQLAIGLDHEQTVEPDGAGAVRAHRDANAAHLRAISLAALLLALVPLEQRGALVQRFLDERAGGVLPDRLGTGGRAKQCLSGRRIDAADLHLIDPELARRFREHRLCLLY